MSTPVLVVASGVLALAGAGCGRVAFDPPGANAGGPGDGADAPGCRSGYVTAGGGCYRPVFDEAGLDWLAAELDCEADGAGAHLVVFDDAAEAIVVDDLAPDSITDYWIGASDLVTEGVYLSVTNMPIGYTTFAPLEPDGLLDNCLRLDAQVELHDTDCANSDDYVCEYDGIPAVPAAYGR